MGEGEGRGLGGWGGVALDVEATSIEDPDVTMRDIIRCIKLPLLPLLLSPLRT